MKIKYLKNKLAIILVCILMLENSLSVCAIENENSNIDVVEIAEDNLEEEDVELELEDEELPTEGEQNPGEGKLPTEEEQTPENGDGTGTPSTGDTTPTQPTLPTQKDQKIKLLACYFDKEVYGEDETICLTFTVETECGINVENGLNSIVMNREDGGELVFFDIKKGKNISSEDDINNKRETYSICIDSKGCNGGKYHFETFTLQDVEQNTVSFYNSEALRDKYLIVDAPNRDSISPVFKGVEIYVDGELAVNPEVEPGDTICIKIYAEDNDELDFFTSVWRPLQYDEGNLDINGFKEHVQDNNRWELNYVIPKAAKPSEYVFGYVLIYDKSGNHSTMSFSDYQNEDDVPRFTVKNDEYSEGFKILSTNIIDKEYLPGELCKIKMKVNSTEHVSSLSLWAYKNGKTIMFIPLYPVAEENALETDLIIPVSWQAGDIDFSSGTIFYDSESGLTPGNIQNEEAFHLNCKLRIGKAYSGVNDSSVLKGTAFDPLEGVKLESGEGDITSRIQVVGNVDTSKPGLYLLRYRTRSDLASVYKGHIIDPDPYKIEQSEGIYYASRWIGVTEVLEPESGELVVTDENVAIGGETEDIVVTDSEGNPVDITNDIEEEGSYIAEEVQKESATTTSSFALNKFASQNDTSDADHSVLVGISIDKTAPDVNVELKGNVISVAVTDKSGIECLKYLEGDKEITDFKNDGSNIPADGKIAAENGKSYTIYAADKLGNECTKQIKVATHIFGKDDIKVQLANPNAKYVYTGNPFMPAVKVTFVSKNEAGKVVNTVLKQNVDYVVTYKDNIDAGQGKIIVEGVGEYSGEHEEVLTFNISPKSIKGVKADPIPDMIYAPGIESNLSDVIRLTDANLVVNKDEYKLYYALGSAKSYSESIPTVSKEKGEIISVYVRGTKHNYSEDIYQKIGTFTLYPEGTVKKNISTCTALIKTWDFTFSGKQCIPKVAVYDENNRAVAGKNYKVICRDNINAGTATVYVYGCKDYFGNVKVGTVNIKKKNINKCKLVVSGTSLVYNGNEQKNLNIVVKDGNTVLTEGLDYKLEYTGDFRNLTTKDNKPIVTVVALDSSKNYINDNSGKKLSKEFKIVKGKLNSKASISTQVWYDGVKLIPDDNGKVTIAAGADPNKLQLKVFYNYKELKGSSYVSKVSVSADDAFVYKLPTVSQLSKSGKQITISAVGKNNFTGTVNTKIITK